jgi:phage terminase Nu1 subunit (DNA packaging protein)
MTAPSIRKLAELLGISHTALNKHLKAGKFAAEPGGGFDVERVRAALKRNADFDQSSQAKHTAQESSMPREAGEPDDPIRGAYNKARAHKETTRAKQADLDFKARVGELLDAAEVEGEWARVGTRVKDEVMALPVRIVNRLPDEWRREVFAIISEETRRALNAIHHEFEPAGQAA